MTDIILSRRGTIDKYMGDCIMAFWNAPLDDPAHGEHACASALAMMDALDALNTALRNEAGTTQRASPTLEIGIGINTGECVVGNMGSEQRFDYSVLGDAVNLAARLEGQSKAYGVNIIIAESTRAAVADWAAIELDLIVVKGKAEAVRIYALLGDAASAQDQAFVRLQTVHTEMLIAYRHRRWPEARAALDACRKLEPRLAGLYDLYTRRMDDFLSAPPAADWQGVHVADSK
jgi:adenylate cyclase